MKTKSLTLMVLFTFVFLSALAAPPGDEINDQSKKLNKHLQKQQAAAFMKNQPVEFIQNRGQMSDINGNPVPYVLFKAEAPGVDLYITDKGLQYVFIKAEEKEDENENQFNIDELPGNEHEKLKISYEKIEMQLLNASIKKENVVLEDSSTAYFNFMMDRAPKIINHVRKYKKVTIQNIYPGIDWVLYNSDKKGFKYDFVVRPGADARQIEMVYLSKHEAEIDSQGNLVVMGKLGTLRENTPFSYYTETKEETKIDFFIKSSTKIKGWYQNHISLTLPPGYKPNKNTLVIDPQLIWSTFYGGYGVEGSISIEVDKVGNFVITGYLANSVLPLLNAGSYFQTIPTGGFILKFTNTGVLLWATYYGGTSGGTSTNSITTDIFNNIFLCGETTSTVFPVVNALTFFQGSLAGSGDAFISKFDALGNCLWATYYGGTTSDIAYNVDTDLNGNVFVVGRTNSGNFPLQNAGSYFEAAITGTLSGFVLKFDNNGNRLWSTYFKGVQCYNVTLDINNNVYVSGPASQTSIATLNPGGTTYFQGTWSGQNIFIAKFTNTGNQLWTTFFGGNVGENLAGLEADNAGNLFVLGSTYSNIFPLQNAGGFFQSSLQGQSDMFITKFNPAGTLLWSTYFGGTRNDLPSTHDNIAIDSCGYVNIAFHTVSRNLPVQFPCDSGFFDASLDTTVTNPNYYDIFIARFTNSGALTWATYFGGDGADFRSSLAVDRRANLFVTGEWTGVQSNISYPIPVSIGPYYSNFNGGDDIFITKLLAKPPSPTAQTFSYQNNICITDTNHLPIPTPGFQAGGTFTSQPGLALNPLTGQITSSFSIPGTYTVNYFNTPCFCYSVATLQMGSTMVQIVPVPTIAVAAPAPICAGLTATASASGANSYTWMPGSLTGSIQSFSPSGNTTYTITGSNIACTSNPFIFTITVNPSPTVVVASSTICENELIIVNASGANGYVWNPGVLSGSMQTFNPPSSTAYTITGTSNLGCVSQSTFNITVSACTGLEHGFAKAGLKVFPNPSKGEITVLSAEELQLQLFAADGKLVRDMHLSTSNNYKITIEGLAKGVYFLRANGSDKNSGHKIIVEN